MVSRILTTLLITSLCLSVGATDYQIANKASNSLQVTTAFMPVSAWTNCLFWITAESPIINSGTTNAQWVCYARNCNSNAYQATVSLQPIKSTRGGENCILLDGSDDFLLTERFSITGAYSVVHWFWIDADSTTGFRTLLASTNHLVNGFLLDSIGVVPSASAWEVLCWENQPVLGVLSAIYIPVFQSVQSTGTWTCVAATVGTTSNTTFAISHLGNVYKPAIHTMTNPPVIRWPLFIGRRSDGVYQDGAVYSTAVFSPAITDTNEMKAVMNAMRPKSVTRVP